MAGTLNYGLGLSGNILREPTQNVDLLLHSIAVNILVYELVY